jgi:hypothetical protein
VALLPKFSFSCFSFPISKDGLCGAHSRKKMRRHTCTKYFAKSKIGSKANNSYNHDREVHVYGMGYVEINDDNSK